jgi:hypothetical protein
MKSQVLLKRSFYLQLLLMVPTIALLGLAGCTGTNGLGTNRAVAMLTGADGGHLPGDNLTIGRRTYNAETHSFDRPWPFGPESNQP